MSRGKVSLLDWVKRIFFKVRGEMGEHVDLIRCKAFLVFLLRDYMKKVKWIVKSVMSGREGKTHKSAEIRGFGR